MTLRKITTGGEIVSYCTKCKLDLSHRIIAMVDGIPAKVECRTCGSHHKYRRPVEERAVEQRRANKAVGTPAPRAPRASSSARALAEAAADNDRERLWQEKIAGRMASEFATYSPRKSFREDQFVHHVKFGDGYVTRIIDINKIEVMFRDCSRVLAQGIETPAP